MPTIYTFYLFQDIFKKEIMDFTIFWYPVHLQKLPSKNSLTSSSVDILFFLHSSAVIINPGVQKPHCNPSARGRSVHQSIYPSYEEHEKDETKGHLFTGSEVDKCPN